MNNCLNCGLETSNPKFCTRSCSASYSNKRLVRRKAKALLCNKCGSSYVRKHSGDNQHRSDRICQSCSFELRDFRNKTLGDYWSRDSVKDKHPSWKNSHVRQLCRSWNKDKLDKPCASCGYDKHVELAHIKPISEFDSDSRLCDVNSSDNVVQLCRNCHWEFDHNILKLSDFT